MIEKVVKYKPKTSSLSHQPKPVFAMQKLAGFADKAIPIHYS